MTVAPPQPVGRLEDFPVGSWRIVRVGRREVGVYNTGRRLHAVLNVCPHQGAPLCLRPLRDTLLPSAPGERVHGLEERVLRCPWHGWEFDVEGGDMLFATGTRRLTLFDVEVRDGHVYVRPRQPRREDP